MNLHITNIIIRREYLNRVKKKSFLITTFLVPVLFAAICILPSIIMMATKEDAKRVAVIDRSGIVLPILEDNANVSYQAVEDMSLDSLKANLKELGYDAVLSISDLDPEKKSVSADIFSVKPLGVETTELIDNRINDAVEAYRISSYNIAGLGEIMDSVKGDVRMKAYTIGEDGKETITESGVYMAVSMVLGMIIYMFITLFGAAVMSSVIEEKASRVVEVLVSSVKATELLFGKIIGVALVAMTQFLLWIVLSGAIIGVVGGILGPKLLGDSDPMEMVQGMNMGVDASTMESVVNAASEPGELSVIFSTLGNLPVGTILVCFFLFFIFGYMLYASMFAAIGSAVENEGDTQQLQIPLTIPLMLGFFVALYAFKAPESSIVFWGSMFPFTSPIVMLARIPFGVATWEIVLSIALLIGTFILCAWISAKIYKVGILIFGKKSTWKDLWNWFKQS